MTDLYKDDRKTEFADMVRNPDSSSTYHGDQRVDIAYYPPLVFTAKKDREISSFTSELCSTLMRMLFDPEIQDFYPRSGLNEVLLQLQKQSSKSSVHTIPFGFRLDFMQDHNNFYLIEINAVNYCAMCDITPPTRALMKVHPELRQTLGYRDVVQSKTDHLGKFGRNVGIVWYSTETKRRLKEAEPEEFENQYFLDQAKNLDISIISSNEVKHIELDKDNRLVYKGNVIDSAWIRYPATLSSVLKAIDFVEMLYRTKTPIYDHPRNMLLEDRNLLAMLCDREFVERYCNRSEELMSHIPATSRLSPNLIPMIRNNPDASVVKMSDLHAGKGVYIGNSIKNLLDFLEGKAQNDRNLLEMLSDKEFVERYLNTQQANRLKHMLKTAKSAQSSANEIENSAGKEGICTRSDASNLTKYLEDKIQEYRKGKLEQIKDIGRYFLQQRIAPYELDVDAISGRGGKAITDFAVYASGFHNIPSKRTYTKIEGYLSRFQFKGDRMITNISQGGGVIPVLVEKR